MATDRFLPQAIRRGLCYSLAVSLFVIVWLNARTVTPATLDLLRRANPLYVLLACGAMAFAWLAETLRFQALLRLSGERVGLRPLLRIVLATFFAASVTPFATGQGPVQIYLLHREGPSVGRAAAILSLRVFLTIVTFAAGVPLLLLLFRLGITDRVHALVNWAVAASVLLALVFFAFLRRPHAIARAVHAFTARRLGRLFRPEAVDRLLDRLVAEVAEFTAVLRGLDRRRIGWLLTAVLLTVVYWIFYFAAAPLLLAAFGRPFNAVKVMALQAVFFFLLSTVPIPGGSGLAELGFAQIFAHLLPAPLVGIFVSLWRLITYYLSLLAGGFVFLGLLTRDQAGSSGGSSKV